MIILAYCVSPKWLIFSMSLVMWYIHFHLTHAGGGIRNHILTSFLYEVIMELLSHYS